MAGKRGFQLAGRQEDLWAGGVSQRPFPSKPTRSADAEPVSSKPSPLLVPLVTLALFAVALMVRLVEDDRVGRLAWPLIAESMANWLMVLSPGVLVFGAVVGWGFVGMWVSGACDRGLLRFWESNLMGLGCGMALLPLAVILLGSLPLNQGMAQTALMVVGWGLGGVVIRDCHRKGIWSEAEPVDGVPVLGSSRGGRLIHGVVTVGLVVAGLYLLVAVFSPPLLFDVTEYHVGAFRAFADAGRFVPVDHNFYARFPWPVQSLYYASLWMGGGWHLDSGAWSDAGPKVINAGLIAAAGALAGLWTRRVIGTGRSWAPSLAALAVWSHPVLLDVSFDAFIDGPIAFMAATALFALWRCSVAPGGWALLPVAGICVGGVLATKYTILQQWAIPAFFLFGIPALKAGWSGEGHGKSKALLALGLAFAVPALWMGRNAWLYGNPVEPFAAALFHGGQSMEALRERTYVESHFPQAPWSFSYWVTLPRRLGGLDTLMLAAGLLPVLWVLVRGRRTAGTFPWGRIVLLWLGTYLLWNLVRESQQRFLLPLAVPIAVAGTTGLIHPETPLWLRRSGVVLLVAFAWSSLIFQGMRLFHADIPRFALVREPNHRPEQRVRLQEFVIRNLGGIGEVAARVQRELPVNSVLLLVHEARPYLFGPRSVFCTIWDGDPLLESARKLGQELGRSPSPQELRLRLKAEGITHVLVNREELLRYVRQYARDDQYREAGIARQVSYPEPAYQLLTADGTPEDLYLPWSIHPDWQRVRAPLIDLLRELRAQATITTGSAPLEIWVAPLAGTNPAQ